MSLKLSLNHRPAYARIPTAYYVYRIVFSKHDIPRLRATYWLPQFPHSEREIWVKQRQVRDLLLAIEPEARWRTTKHRDVRDAIRGVWEFRRR